MAQEMPHIMQWLGVVVFPQRRESPDDLYAVVLLGWYDAVQTVELVTRKREAQVGV